MAYIEVVDKSGVIGIGSAFHVGGGVFITARHVLENKDISKIATTERKFYLDLKGSKVLGGSDELYSEYRPGEGKLRAGPFFHPDPLVDVAAIVVEGLKPESIPLGGMFDDMIMDSDFILTEAIVMGYPRIPFSKTPVIVAARAEVNAIIDKYNGPNVHFIVSSVARGGFSGGVCLHQWGMPLGLVTESLNRNNLEPELGYMAVLSVEPIYECLYHHKICPEAQNMGDMVRTYDV